VARVLFFHGRESGPAGTKAAWLRERFGAVTPQLESLGEVEDALPAARQALREVQPEVVVGSSFGGAVAVALLREGLIRVPVVLIAPAARRLGVPNAFPEGARAVILHGELDDLVPLEDSVALARTGGPGVELQVVAGGDHRLNEILGSGALAEAIEAVSGR
jgi:hypothetical protein